MSLTFIEWVVLLFGGAFLVFVVLEEYKRYQITKKIEWSKIFSILLIAYILYKLQTGT